MVDTLKLWSCCSESLGYSYARKGTPEYDEIKELFLIKLEEENMRRKPELRRWKECCEKLAIDPKLAKRGTSDHKRVQEIFRCKVF